jgi:hypothetical protein
MAIRGKPRVVNGSWCGDRAMSRIPDFTKVDFYIVAAEDVATLAAAHSLAGVV